MVGPMALQFPEAASHFRLQEANRRRRHELRRVCTSFHGRRSRGRCIRFAIQRRAYNTEKRSFCENLSHEYGKVPSYFSESNYTTAQIIDETVKKAGGKWPGA
jgi:branched-chain amino acid transport system substrate-binding protein